MGDLSREPSMEDILSSIRRVIARDEAPAPARAAPTANEDDILDLGTTEADASTADDTAKEKLVSAASADAARQSIEALTAAVTPVATAAVATTPPSNGRSMEDVVIEALRPMLKEWLDTNLPSLVETLVAREISRITGKRG